MLETLQLIFGILFLIMLVIVVTIGALQRKLTNNYQNVKRSGQLFYIAITPVALWMTSGIILLIVGIFS